MGTVHAVTSVDAVAATAALDWEAGNAEAIARHWADAAGANPSLFDGIVYMATRTEVAGGIFRAVCHPMRFAGLLWWRHLGIPLTGFRTIFSNIILRGSDGGLIMALMAPRTATAGIIGFPGGAYDEHDLAGDRLDATGCILRECQEETGIGADEISLAPGYLVYEDDVRVAIGRVGDLACDAATARERIAENLARQVRPELAEVFVVRDDADLDRLSPHPYSRELAHWILANA